MRKVVWQSDTLKTLQGFPDPVKYDFGVELMRVQFGQDPIDWKPMRSVGPGVKEMGPVSRPISLAVRCELR